MGNVQPIPSQAVQPCQTQLHHANWVTIIVEAILHQVPPLV